MARGGTYKSEVKRARDTLVAQGRHPSLDAVRIELGNTGSKTTIHRYLKELAGEEGQPIGTKVAVSDALADLVGRLSERLHEEAEAVIAEAKSKADAAVAERDRALEAQRQESAALRSELERTHTNLVAERNAHGDARRAITAHELKIAQLEERLNGMASRLQEQEAHAASLEEKHRNAREALEHFRTAAKEQREQESRRHEHVVQGLQTELRHAAETIAAKTQEALQLNRDNGRLSEQHAQSEKDLRSARAALQTAEGSLREQQALAAAHERLEARCASLLAENGEFSDRVKDLTVRLEAARNDRIEADAARERALARAGALEEVLARLTPRPKKPKSVGESSPQATMLPAK